MRKPFIILFLTVALFLPLSMEAVVPAPTNFRITFKSDTRIFIAWDAPSLPSSYLIGYQTKILPVYADVSNPAYTWNTVSERTYSFTRLTPNTSYRILLRTYRYSSTDWSDTIDTIITTEPTFVITQLPYRCDFEPHESPYRSSEVVDLPNGFRSTSIPVTTLTLYTIDRITSGQDPERPNVYHLKTSQNNNYAHLLTLPDIDTSLYPINTLQVRFSAASMSSQPTSFLVGLSNYTNDTNGFETLRTVTLTNGRSQTEVTVPLTNCHNSTGLISFIFPRRTPQVTIDDIVIERIPEWQPPRNLVVDQISTTSATLHWSVPSATPQRYSIRLQPHDNTLPTRQYYDSQCRYVASHLHPDTRYTVYVSADYGGTNLSTPDSVVFRTAPLPCLAQDTADHTFTLSGDSAYGTNSLPVRTGGRGYIINRQLILQREIDTLGTITGIDFLYLSPDPLDDIDSCIIFMGNTTENRITDIPLSCHRTVYNGPLHCTQGWNHFEFDSPITYTGGNLFIDVWWATPPDNPNVVHDSNRTFQAHLAPYCSSDISYLYTSYPYSTNYYHLRNDMRLHYRRCLEGDSCAKASISVIQDSAGASEIAWNEGLSDNFWDIYLQSPTDSVPVLIDSLYPASRYTFTNLTGGLNYTISVVPWCDGTPSPAHADTLYYLAPCPVIDNLPFTLNFDTAIGASECYSFMGNVSRSNSYAYFDRNEWFPQRPDGSAYTDTLHYSISMSMGSIVLPRFEEDIRNLTMSFLYTGNTGYSVGIIPDGDTIFIPFASISNPGVNHFWNRGQVNFSSYVGRPGRIAIRNSRSDVLYLDSISIDRIQTCTEPTGTIHVSNTTATSTMIRWSANPNAHSYEIEYGPGKFELGTGMTASSYGDSVILYGLAPNSHYDFYIRSHCPGGDTSRWTPSLGFITQCAAISTLPTPFDFTQWTSFTSYAEFPSCWTDVFTIPLLCNIIDHTGNRRSALRVSSPYSTNIKLLSLPAIDTNVIPINSTSLRFRAQCVAPANNIDLVVGTMGSSYNSFIPSDTLTVDTVPQWFEVNFGHNPGHYRIAFSIPLVYIDYLLDSIVLEPIPSCPSIRSVHASNVTDTSVDLLWSSSSLNTIMYEVELTDSGGSILTTADPPFFINGLSPGTSYTGRIRVICYGGDTSGWRSFRFTTLPPVARYPYCTGFEDTIDNSLWRVQKNSAYGIDWFPAVEDSSNHYYLLSHANDSVPPAISASTPVALYRDIDFGQADFAYRLSVRLRALSNYPADKLHLFLTTTDYPSTNSLWGNILQHSSHANPSITQAWQTYTFDLDTLQGIHRLVFYWYSPTGGAPIAVDDVCLLMPLCPVPTGLTVDASDTSALVQWQGPNNASYEIVYSPLGNPDEADTITIDTIGLTIGGLTSGTVYTLRVRCICDSERVSPFSSAFNFSTLICSNAQSSFVGSIATAGISTRLPVHTAHPYSYTQQIYTAAEVGRSGEIRSIKFHYDSTSAPTSKPRCRIYMGHTRQEQYITADDIIDEDFDLVYFGDMPATPGWNTLILNSPYHYTDTDNLVLTVVDQSGVSHDSCFYSVDDAGRSTSISLFSSSPIDLQNFSGQSTIQSYHNTVQFDFCPSDGCSKPSLLHPTIHPYHITHHWLRDSSDIAYTLQYRSVDDSIWNSFSTVDTFLYLNIALPSGAYLVRLNRQCPDGTSAWAYRYFNIPVWRCPPVDHFRVDSVGNHTVSLSWTPAESNASFFVHIFNSTFDSVYTSDTSTPTLGGLEINVLYSVAVQADCPDSNTQSIWSDTLTFILPTCPDVSNAWIVSTHGTTATLDWEGDDDVEGWVISYGPVGTPQAYCDTAIARYHPYTIRGLAPEEDYEAYVRAMCYEGYFSEHWSNPIAFTSGVGIASPAGTPAFILRPNPTRGTVQVIMHQAEGHVRIEVLDLVGRTWMVAASGDKTTVDLDLQQLPAGIYMVRVSTDEFTSVQRLIKQ